ncbi:pseudopilin I [Asaia sp. W19]|nr:type II secretion system protein [Asaia sp. W19]RUT24145.1 pseudopilin I [Asaia sp. W19]
MGAPADAESGFTLIEVLIAFIIVAFSLGVLYEGMLDGVGATHRANAEHEALSRAQSHMAAIGHGMRPGSYAQSGEDGSGFAWHVVMTPREVSGSLVLYHVAVTESWPDPLTASGRGSITLTSLRLGKAETP